MGHEAAQSSHKPGALRAWWLAARPHTLSISLCPVLAGGTLAWADTASMRWALLALSLCAALLIQIGTNLLNDVGDCERGADAPGRLGPPRATASGWLSAQAVRRAGLAALGAAFVLGTALAAEGGWPIVWLGLASLFCGWAYTSGPKPIAYGAWGEALAWLFFGLAAVAGTYWLQTGHTSAQAWTLGHCMGAMAAAVMLVNNTRDAATDALAGKRTLAVRLGLARCRLLYGVLLLLPFALLPLLPQRAALPLALLPLLPLGVALWLIVQFARCAPGQRHNALLAWTARLQLLFSACWIATQL